MKNLQFKTDTFYLLDGQTCNEIHAVLTDMKKLAAVYLSDVEEMDLDSDRYQEAMEIFEFVIQRFLKIQKFDSFVISYFVFFIYIKYPIPIQKYNNNIYK